MSSEPRDPALRSLLADLTVSRVSRDPGRVPGGLGLGKISAAPSSENFTLVNEGVSHKSPTMGQPRTVNSLEDEPAAPRGRMPSSISLLSPASLGETRQYRILRVPMDIEIFSTFCFTTIGQGPCVCLAKNCGTAHQGAIVKVKRGELLVSKNPTTVFGEPRIDASILSDELMEEWMTNSLTLEDWESVFRSALAASEEQSKVTAAVMEAQQNFAAKADAYRNPKTKRKRKSLEVPATIGITPYKRQARGEEDFVGLDQESTTQLIVEMVLGSDSGLDQTCSALVKLLEDFYDSSSMHVHYAKKQMKALMNNNYEL
jgi:hypothetical protein